MLELEYYEGQDWFCAFANGGEHEVKVTVRVVPPALGMVDDLHVSTSNSYSSPRLLQVDAIALRAVMA